MSDKINTINFFDKLAFASDNGTTLFRSYFSIDAANGLSLSGENPVGPSTPSGLNAPNFTLNGTLTVTGDVVVAGATVSASSSTLSVTSKNIYMNVPAVLGDTPSSADGAGIVVVRDSNDGDLGVPHAGIIWVEASAGWNFNAAIPVDYDTGIGATNSFVSNPRLMNIGAPVSGNDATNKTYVDDRGIVNLSDVVIAAPSNGQVVKYNSGTSKWVNGSLNFTDLGTVPATYVGQAGKLVVVNGAATALEFVSTISTSKISGLATVASSGDYNDLINLPSASTDTAIQNLLVSPTSYVSTTTVSNSVVMYGDDHSHIVSGPATTVTGGYLTLETNSTYNALASVKIVNGANAGILESSVGLKLKSAGNITIHDLRYPSTDGTAGQYLSTNGAGVLTWSTVVIPSATRLENVLTTTYVDTSLTNDVVRIGSANLGAVGSDALPITNPTGVLLEPGANRFVEITGAGTSTMSSANTLSIVSGVFVDIEGLSGVNINEYAFPDATDRTAATAGDVLIIDPTDTVNKKELTFTTLTLNYLSDVVISSPATGRTIRHNGTNWVDAQLSYSDLSGTPSLVTTVGGLSDVSDVAVANGYLRWNGAGNNVVFETSIPASALNLVGTATNIIPSLDSTNDLGSNSIRFLNTYTDRINGLVWPAGDSTAGYVLSTNGAGTVSWVANSTAVADGSVDEIKLSTAVQNKLNKVYRGRVSNSGVASFVGSSPSGWTVSNQGSAYTTRVRVTHNLGTTAYSVSATVEDIGSYRGYCPNVYAHTNTYFEIIFEVNGALGGVNRNFHFTLTKHV